MYKKQKITQAMLPSGGSKVVQTLVQKLVKKTVPKILSHPIKRIPMMIETETQKNQFIFASFFVNVQLGKRWR
mgnify:CR=1 FL=1